MYLNICTTNSKRVIKINNRVIKTNNDDIHTSSKITASLYYYKRAYSGLFMGSMNFTTSEYRAILYGRPEYRRIIGAIFTSRTTRVVSFLLGNRVRKRWWRWQEMVDADDEGSRWKKVNFENQTNPVGLSAFPFTQILFKINVNINIYTHRTYAKKFWYSWLFWSDVIIY